MKDAGVLRTRSKPVLPWRITVLLTVVLSVGCVVIVFRHSAEITGGLQSLGYFGVLAAVVLMAIFHMTPVPSEGLLLVYFKVFGVWWGLVYSWCGSVLSALLVYVIARYVAQELILSRLSVEWKRQVEHWVRRKGRMGLFAARLLPFPAFALNCIAGVAPGIRFWDYAWTAAVAMIPYYTATGFIYNGVFHAHVGIILGGIMMFILWGVSFLLTRRSRQALKA